MGFVKYEQKEQYAIITIDREKAMFDAKQAVKRLYGR